MLGISCLILGLVLPASAEYRAYQLAIVSEAGGSEQTVISTFDNLQYPVYYPLTKGDRIEYVDSWMCWEDSEYYAPICKKPERQTASETAPKTKSPALEP